MNNPFEAIDARLINIESLLLEIKHSGLYTPPKKDEVELLTVKQAAAFLSLSVPTIYSLISKGELPVMKGPKRCYFSKAELVGYLQERRQLTNSEALQLADKHISKASK